MFFCGRAHQLSPNIHVHLHIYQSSLHVGGRLMGHFWWMNAEKWYCVPSAKAVLFPTYTFLFPSAVILEVCIPDGIVQDGVGPSNAHWTEIYGRNTVSSKPMISGFFWQLIVFTLLLLLHKASDCRYSHHTTELEFIKLKLESLNGERLDALLMYM